jgi:hypothetical protein
MIQIKRSELKQLTQNKLGNDSIESQNKILVMISTAMSAHTSYTIVGGEAVKSYEKWIELHDKLIAYDPPHSSPMEHCARAMNDEEYISFYKGDRRVGYGEGWCRNFRGFIQYREIIENENI